VLEILDTATSRLITGFFTYIPQLIGGLSVLLIGLIVAAAFKKIVLMLFRVLKLEKWLEEAGIAREKSLGIWTELTAELIRWTVVIIFLIPAAEIWGVPRVTEVLNKVLVYLPNVFIAAIVGLVGAVAANFSSDIVRQGSIALGSKSANALAVVTYYAIMFFTALVILNQLGIASDLIRILFTGIVAMLAIAGGLAFGLGGKDMARDVLEQLRKKLK